MRSGVYGLALLAGMTGLAGCTGNEKLLNPAHVDSDFKSSKIGAAPSNVELYAGDLEGAKATIREAGFFPAWSAAAEADRRRKNLPSSDPHPNPNPNPSPDKDDVDAQVSARAMLIRGIALSDRLCAAWFQGLGEAQANMSFWRDSISAGGGLAATILGLARASQPATAGVAAGAAFGQQLIDSASANFIVAPDIGLVQDLITRLRQDQAQGLMAKPHPSYDEVLVMLVNYDNTCTHTKVKQLVNQSVTNATKDASGASSATVQSIIGEIAPYFKVKLTVDDVTALYALLVMTNDSKVKASSAAFLKTLQDDKVVTPGSTASALTLDLTPAYASSPETIKATVRAILQFSFPAALLDAKLATPAVAAAPAAAAAPAVSAAGHRRLTEPATAPASVGVPGFSGQLDQRTLSLPSILR